MSDWKLKYFMPSEFNCCGELVADKMSPKILKMLDTSRNIAGVPMVISSSWRSPEHNAQVGGKPNSAHLRGEAVDIICRESFARYRILEGLIRAGFKRIGISENFIHADTSNDLPTPRVWTY